MALQLASQQFSPRLLREFARDLWTQLVLGILVSTFVVAVTILRSIDNDESLPAVGLGLTFLMAKMSITALLGFLGHIARLVRVDTMMASVHRETRQALDQQYPAYDQRQDQPDVRVNGHEDAVTVTADKSGFVQNIDVQRLVEAAHPFDAYVILGIRPGDHVVVGTPLARVVARLAGCEAVVQAVHDTVALGYERTLEQGVVVGGRSRAALRRSRADGDGLTPTDASRRRRCGPRRPATGRDCPTSTTRGRTLPADLLDDDEEAVRDAERRVYEALRGEVDRAYADRAGETRSM